MKIGDERAERQRAVVRRHLERLSARDRDGWLECFVDEPELIEPADAPPKRGQRALLSVLDRISAGGGQLALEPICLIANGDRVAAHIAVRHRGADGVERHGSVIEIYTFASDDRIASATAFVDPAGLAELRP